MNLLFLNHCLLQAFAAFNDTFIRVGLIKLLIMTFKQEYLVSMAGLILMMPVLFCSYLVGCLITKYNMSHFIKLIKILELLSIILFHMCYYNNNVVIGFIAIFIAGIHAAIYAPIKLTIVYYIFKGNMKQISYGIALIELTTFIVILLGSMAGVLIIQNPIILFSVAYCFSILGVILSFFYPPYGEQNNNTTIRLFDINIFKHMNKKIFYNIYSISLFWFIMTIISTSIVYISQKILQQDTYFEVLITNIVSIGLIVGGICITFIFTPTYNKKLSIIIMFINFIATTMIAYIIYLNEQNIICYSGVFAICLFIITVSFSMYIIPLHGDIINNISDKKYLEKSVGIFTSITTIPIILSLFVYFIITFYINYTTLYLFIAVLILFELINNIRK